MAISEATPLLLMKTGSTIAGLKRHGEDFENWFQQGLGLADSHYRVVNVEQEESLPDVAQTGAVVITGSPAYVTDLAGWNFVAADFLHAAFERNIPILGVCYGHQLLAWAFSGEVGFNPGGRAIGTVRVNRTDHSTSDPLLQGLPASFSVNLSHLQSVQRLPEPAVPLLCTDYDANHGFRLGQNCWGLQFHPEFDGRITRAYIEERRELIEGEGLPAAELAAAVQDTPQSASLLRRFVALANQAWS